MAAANSAPQLMELALPMSRLARSVSVIAHDGGAIAHRNQTKSDDGNCYRPSESAL